MDINLLQRQQTISFGRQVKGITPLLVVAGLLVVGGLGWRIELAHQITTQTHTLQVMQSEVQKAEASLQVSQKAELVNQLSASAKQVEARQPDLGPDLNRIVQLLPSHANVSSLNYQTGVFLLSGDLPTLDALSSFEQALLAESWVKGVVLSGVTLSNHSSRTDGYQYELEIEVKQVGLGGTSQ